MEKLDFAPFAKAIITQFALMQSRGAVLVKTDVGPENIWSHYLDSFPEGTNNMFRTRREYDCNCCKTFIRKMGNVIAIAVDGTVSSIWDVTVPGYHQVVADAMSAYVKSRPVYDYFLTNERTIGTKATPDGDILNSKIVWEHFYLEIPPAYIVSKKDLGTKLGEMRTNQEVFKRAMKEIDIESLETVLELFKSGTVRKGSEYVKSVEDFLKLKREYDALKGEHKKRLYTWYTAKTVGFAVRFRNNVEGTLVADLAKGVELEDAVAAFEFKVDPRNFKRNTAIVTKKMIENATARIKELGIEESLYRRFAVPTDISVNDVLFSASVKKSTNLFEELIADASSKTDPKKMTKNEEVTLDKFVKDILPLASSVEVLFQGKHANNLVSVIAPQFADSKNIFKWNNQFSWAYTGDITDSIKERVKTAGGTVTGDLRVSLAWFNYDDLDLFVIEPNGYRIYFGNRALTSPCGGKLDVDMNVSSDTREAVENIIWSNKSRMTKGVYKIGVNNFNHRESIDVGFQIQTEFDGYTTTLSYPREVRHKDNIFVAEIYFNGNTFEIINKHKDVVDSHSSRELWNMKTETFVPVTMVMNSPNFWNGQEIGNKHIFFILDQCKNPDSARGFFNEYLIGELTPDRKVFELLGTKTKAQPTDVQVSGLGFSEKRDDLTVRVTGKTARTYTIKF